MEHILKNFHIKGFEDGSFTLQIKTESGDVIDVLIPRGKAMELNVELDEEIKRTSK